MSMTNYQRIMYENAVSGAIADPLSYLKEPEMVKYFDHIDGAFRDEAKTIRENVARQYMKDSEIFEPVEPTPTAEPSKKARYCVEILPYSVDDRSFFVDFDTREDIANFINLLRKGLFFEVTDRVDTQVPMRFNTSIVDGNGFLNGFLIA